MQIANDILLSKDFNKLGPVLWECKYCHARNDRFWAAKHLCLKKEVKK